MQLDQVSACVIAVLQDIAGAAGRVLLLACTLTAALFGTVLLVTLPHTVAVITGEASVTTLYNGGVWNTVQDLYSFTDAETSVYFASLVSAVLMGAFMVWVYQNTGLNLHRRRR